MTGKILSLLAVTFILFFSTNAQNIPDYVPKNGLVTYYSFSGNANDETGSGNNGVINGATLTTDKKGISNKAYSFNGANNTINLPNSFLGGGQVNAFTFRALVKFNSTSNAPNIWGKTLFWGEVNFYVTSKNEIAFVWANSITGNKYSVIASQENALQPGVWNDIVIVFQNSIGKIYLNGLPITTLLRWDAQGGSTISTTQIEATCNFAQDANSSRFGVRNSGGSWGNYLNGIIDDFGIWNRALSQQEITNLSFSQTNCSLNSYIVNNDTTVCAKSTINLNINTPCSSSPTQSLSWQLLIPGANIPTNGFNVKPFGFDRANQILYTAQGDPVNRLQKFDLKTNTVTQIPATGWFGRMDEFTFDQKNNRIIGSRAGRDNVYAIPVTGGTWTLIGSGSADNDSYGGMYFWNSITNRPSFFGGYGLYQVKNWIWENNGSGWINTRPNLSDCQPAKRGGGSLQAANSDYSKYYIFSGQGSCDGNQFASSCSLGSPWQTDVGQYCWLRDLWELDLKTYQFTNILPANNQSIVREGTMAYDYDNNTFYTIGGIIPTGTYGVYGAATMDVYKMKRSVDNGFSLIQVGGSAPPVNNNGAYSIFDPLGKRIIYARQDGIWALNLTPSCNYTYTWSTGQLDQNITVSPSQTTKYYVTISDGTTSCRDSVTVTVNGAITQQPTTKVSNNGQNVQFTTSASSSNSIAYQWQTNSNNLGWQNVPNNTAYSGASTNTLTVANVQLSNHNQPFRVIATSGNCVDTSSVALIKISDTCLLKVTDTLVINTVITSLTAPNNENTIKIYPNPTSSQIIIDFGTFSRMNGYAIRINNTLGQQVFASLINKQQSIIDISSLGSKGIYFVQIIDPQNKVIDTRKIILQ